MPGYCALRHILLGLIHGSDLQILLPPHSLLLPLVPNVQARSLVQLLQQTQGTKDVTSRAMRALAAEAAAQGVPPEELAPQMDAIR